jgi:hypothetical protein
MTAAQKARGWRVCGRCDPNGPDGNEWPARCFEAGRRVCMACTAEHWKPKPPRKPRRDLRVRVRDNRTRSAKRREAMRAAVHA